MEEVKEELERQEIVTNIEYVQPKFWHRVLANFVDIFIFLIMLIAMFFSTRGIVQSTPNYQANYNFILDSQLSSGLYVKYNNNMQDIIYFCDQNIGVFGGEFEVQEEPYGKNGYCVKAIDTFMKYINEKCDINTYNELVQYYDDFRLNTLYNGVHYFIVDSNDQIIPNPDFALASNHQYYYQYIYTPMIEKYCFSFFTTHVEDYYNALKIDSNYLIYLELPVAYFLAAFLTYFVPPLFFRRGRMTLGKALYHIGLIDRKRVLSPTFARFLARFAIFFFGELVLSLFSFGVPFIISTSMMAFSKNRQGFPDYMLNLQEVDTSNNRIYLDYVDATLKDEPHKKATSFRMKKPL